MSQHRTEPHTHEPRDREVIVTDGGRGPSGIGAVIAAIIGILAVVLVAWLLFFSGGGETGDGEPVVPEEVEVDVNDGTGGGDLNEGGETG